MFTFLLLFTDSLVIIIKTLLSFKDVPQSCIWFQAPEGGILYSVSKAI